MNCKYGSLCKFGRAKLLIWQCKKGLENYVCQLYGSGSTNLEQVRWDTYNRNQDPDKLPPTADALKQNSLFNVLKCQTFFKFSSFENIDFQDYKTKMRVFEEKCIWLVLTYTDI